MQEQVQHGAQRWHRECSDVGPPAGKGQRGLSVLGHSAHDPSVSGTLWTLCPAHFLPLNSTQGQGRASPRPEFTALWEEDMGESGVQRGPGPPPFVSWLSVGAAHSSALG